MTTFRQDLEQWYADSAFSDSPEAVRIGRAGLELSLAVLAAVPDEADKLAVLRQIFQACLLSREFHRMASPPTPRKALQCQDGSSDSSAPNVGN
mgnify:CR=1 FL=1